MRSELQDAAKLFLSQEVPEELPTVSPAHLKRLIALAMLASRMRGVVHRDPYNPSMLHAKSCYEIGTRLGKQLMKLLYGITMYYQLTEANDRCFDIVAKVALDSVADRTEELVRTLWELGPEPALTAEVVEACQSLTRSTVQRQLEDLRMLGMVTETGSSGKKLWALSKDSSGLIEQARIWRKK